jgi:hypothetical protein
MTWGSPVEIERRNRIMVSVWAYAYEIMDDSLVSDEVFDQTCLKIQSKMPTDNAIMDEFFATEFSPDSGVWIYKHPDHKGVVNLYQHMTGKNGKPIYTYKNDTPPVTKSVSNMGFKTHVEMKWYLASLGFRVIPHWCEHDGRWCKTEFDDECGRVTDEKTGEQITIFYKELFNRAGDEK